MRHFFTSHLYRFGAQPDFLKLPGKENIYCSCRKKVATKEMLSYFFKSQMLLTGNLLRGNYITVSLQFITKENISC